MADTKKDAERYRKIHDLGTYRAADLIRKVGTAGLDQALDKLRKKQRDRELRETFLPSEERGDR